MSYSKFHALISRPLQIFSTVLILLVVLAAADGIAIGIVSALTYWRYLPKNENRDIKKENLTDEEAKQKRISHSTIKFMPDGTIHLLYYPKQPQPFLPRYTMRGYQPTDIPTVEIYDTNDNMLWEGKQDDIPYQYLGWSADRTYIDQDYDNFNNNDGHVSSSELWQMESFMPQLSQTLELNFELKQGPLEIWRYNPSKEFFTGFIARDTKIGYIGASGFTTSKEDARPFGKLRSIQNFNESNLFRPCALLQTNNRLYQIDLQARQVEVLFESNGVGIDNFSINRCSNSPPSVITPYLKLFNENCRPYIDCVMHNKNHHLIFTDSSQKLSLNLPDEWYTWNEKKIEITATKQAVFLHRSWTNVKPQPNINPLSQNDERFKAWWDENMSKPRITSDELYMVNDDGSLKLISSFTRTRPASKIPPSYEQPHTAAMSALTFLRAFSSPVYTIAWNKYEDKFSNMLLHERTFLSMISSLIISGLHPDKMLPNILLSFIFVLIALWHSWARRTSIINLLLWLIIVGAFNLAGFLAYLALNHIPTIKCPVCGKKRSLQMPNCIHCGNPLPIPQPKSTDLVITT